MQRQSIFDLLREYMQYIQSDTLKHESTYGDEFSAEITVMTSRYRVYIDQYRYKVDVYVEEEIREFDKEKNRDIEYEILFIAVRFSCKNIDSCYRGLISESDRVDITYRNHKSLAKVIDVIENYVKKRNITHIETARFAINIVHKDRDKDAVVITPYGSAKLIRNCNATYYYPYDDLYLNEHSEIFILDDAELIAEVI